MAHRWNRFAFVLMAFLTASCSGSDSHLSTREAAEALAKQLPGGARSRLTEILMECIAAKAEGRPSTIDEQGCEGAVWQECLAAWSDGRDPDVGKWRCEDIGEKP